MQEPMVVTNEVPMPVPGIEVLEPETETTYEPQDEPTVIDGNSGAVVEPPAPPKIRLTAVERAKSKKLSAAIKTLYDRKRGKGKAHITGLFSAGELGKVASVNKDFGKLVNNVTGFAFEQGAFLPPDLVAAGIIFGIRIGQSLPKR